MDNTANVLDNITVSLWTSRTFEMSAGSPTAWWDLDFPVGDGLLVVALFGVADDVLASMALDKQVTASAEYNDNFTTAYAYYERVTDRNQRLTLGNTAAGSVSGTVYLYRVQGGGAVGAVGTRVASTSYSATLQAPGSSTLVFVVGETATAPSGYTGAGSNQWRSLLSSNRVMVLSNAVNGTYNYSTSDVYHLEIKAKDTVRRKRFVARHQGVYTTQPKTRNVQVIERYRPNVLAAWVAGVGNFGPYKHASVPDVDPPGGWLGLPQGTAFNRTANEQYVVSCLPREYCAGITYAVMFYLSQLDGYLRLFTSYGWNGNQRIGYTPVGWELNPGFGVNNDAYLGGTYVHKSNSDIRLQNQLVSLVCTWHKDKNSGLGRMWQNGVEIPNDAGAAQTTYCSMQWSGRWQWGYDGAATGLSAVILDTDMHPDDAKRVSLNGWCVYEPRENQTICTGQPVITHKRRRVL
jgi:hypothetical protein